jgi:molybdenum cofactor cytidylyltransferase
VELLAALDIRPGDRVALVGGGGKTGLACRLVEEARRRGWTALFTTTTRLLSPEHGADAYVIGEPNLESLRQELSASGALFLARDWLDEWEDTPSGRQRKVGGFSPTAIADLVNNLNPDLALVEADGSRHRPFKAPAAYEPVLPPTTTLLVVVAGLSVLGLPLSDAAVHRPERVAELGGIALGTPVSAALVATVLAHPAGGLKGCPPGARVVAVLAQATETRLPAGRGIARRLLPSRRFERVLLTDLDDPASTSEVWQSPWDGGLQVEPGHWPRVHAVVLAAGRSRRMGRNKLLLPLGGRPLVGHAVEAALGSRAADVWVVLGADGEAIRAALLGEPVRFLANPGWAEGQAASLRTAVAELPAWSEGVLFLAADMPFVPPAHLDRLVECLRPGVGAVWSGYGGARGTPALFGRDTFVALRQLQGDTGGRVLAGQFVEEVVPAAFPLLDVDTPEEYQQACRRLEEDWAREHSAPADVHGTGSR